jgi:UDP-N-acetylglucosamine--N-acetylmuramyl-(pentapeptide) pyrophosphoryl-undecaprenol N-acetylglucosamine transferase
MRVLIAGGGTGGHLFPGMALAEECVGRHPENDAIFVGTQRGLEARVVPRAGFPFESITSRGLKGMGPFKLLWGLLTLPFSFLQALRILWRYRPDVVVGVGGYSSGPVVLMAWLLGLPTAIQEQNARPGFTNRVLGHFVGAVFVAFHEAIRAFEARRTHLLGNPIRKTLVENFLRPNVAHQRFALLVLGGSLGAKGLNARVLEAVDFLGDVKALLAIVHQTGRADLEAVAEGYARRGCEADVRDFIDDMSAAYSRADLVICRAGASTLSELAVCRKPSVLVPFPHATDDHQAANAKAMVDAGAAIMLREAQLTGEALAQTIRGLMGDAAALRRMEKAAGALGRPQAAREIADVLVELSQKKWGPNGRGRRGPPLRPAEPRNQTP